MVDDSEGANKAEPVPSEPIVPATQSRKRRPAFYVLAMLLGLTPFLALELTLRLLGVEADAASTDLHDGFDESTRLFQPDEDGLLTTDIGRERFFVRQTFPATKPEKEFRIFVLGGSTVQGRPYLPDTAFSNWLQQELDATDTDHDYRVVNCGGISYASFRLRPMVNEVLTYDPDLIIVATGHNEFLEDRTYASLKARSSIRLWLENSAKSLRTVMLLRRLTGGAARTEPTTETASSQKEIQTRLDDPSGYASYKRDPVWSNAVLAQFQDSLGSMKQACDTAAVPLVLVRLGSNLRDCPPFKSEHKDNLSVEDQQQWQDLFDRATELDDTDPSQAIEFYRQASTIDDEYALLHFRLGRCYDRIGNVASAAQHYELAKDLDICPLRMKSEFAEHLASLAKGQDVPVFDAESVVAASCSDSICGFESYIDHVHPTIFAHQRIGKALAAELVSKKLVPAERILSQSQRRADRRQLMTELGDIYFSNGRRRIGWLEGWAQRKRLKQETTPTDIRSLIAMASRNIDLHRFEDAESDLLAALDLDGDPELIVDLAQRLFASGRNLDAKWLLGMLVQRHEKQPLPAAVSMGLLAVALDEDDQSALDAAAANPDWTGKDLRGVLQSDDTGWGRIFGDR